MTKDAQIIVVGGGLAGLSAALAARETGVSVILIERAPHEERGGNSRFSNGAMRAVYNGVGDVVELVGDLSDQERANTDFGSYSREQYFDDMARVTEYRTDPVLADLLVDRSRDCMRWLRAQGVRFLPLYEWQVRLPDGRIKFAGGSAVEANGAGEGITAAMYAAAERAGVKIVYGTRVTELIETEQGVSGVRARCGRKTEHYSCAAIILACGGFEANAEWRARYLGPSWELAKVRGSRFNTGDGLSMALAAGAMAAGNWSGCHSSSWDHNAPDANELAYGTIFKRDDYLYGIVVNARGERFFDEGADIRALTYAKLGRAILAQPGQIAWQIFDRKGSDLLHGEYRVRQAARFRASTLETLLPQLEGLNVQACLATIGAFNQSVRADIPLDRGKRDGRGTSGLAVPKSNWAMAIEEPPFEAFAVTCGVTFTFGGVKIDERGQVLDQEGARIPGLFAAGEMVGGLFYFNYPGGSGLMAAAVFGRLAGQSAATSLTA
jgi:tricarballylate dehydrogenase